MIAKCVCNQCPGHLEFDAKDAGQTITCPHCGAETVLFIPSGTQYQTAPNRSDGCIFKNGNVTVTPALLTVGLSTFPISAISSFRVVGIPPSQRKIIRLSLFTVLVLLFGIFVLACNAADNNHSAGGQMLGWTLICLAGITLAIIVFAKAIPTFGYKLMGKPLFGLNITMSAGEQTVITSPEIETVDAIGEALRQAISKATVGK
jgi:hypothetical protein